MATYESKKYAHTGASLTDIAATSIADGTVSDSEYQFINSLASNAQTQITARLPLAGGTMTGDLNFGDNVDINVGTGTDLKILHDGSNSTIKNTTGTLKINADTVQFKNEADNSTFLTVNSSSGVLSEQNYKATISTSNPSGGSNGDVWYKYS